VGARRRRGLVGVSPEGRSRGTVGRGSGWEPPNSPFCRFPFFSLLQYFDLLNWADRQDLVHVNNLCLISGTHLSVFVSIWDQCMISVCFFCKNVHKMWLFFSTKTQSGTKINI
jgi:hypothetical protein